MSKEIKEPIPKLKLISPNLEFGDVNRSYDAENIFETIINVEKSGSVKILSKRAP
jgi:hypothetical protein